jgi:hypothetical protein
MNLLLDEDVPLPLMPILSKILVGHSTAHVYDVGWAGKKDKHLFADARQRGFNAVLTNNIRQFNDPVECRAIQRSGLHHISYETINGIVGLALAAAAICAAILPIVRELDGVGSQRVVKITAVSGGHKRYKLQNPATDPPSAYWP